jgi:hypothetical protein
MLPYIYLCSRRKKSPLSRRGVKEGSTENKMSVFKHNTLYVGMRGKKNELDQSKE